MTKAELIDAIKARLADNTNTKHIHEKTVIAAVLDALGVVAGAALFDGAEVPMVGLGKLKVKVRAPRRGRNPKTGAAIDIPAKRTVLFQPSAALTQTVNC